MDLEAAQATVERACEEFKVPATAAAASAVLLQFRSSPGVLQACRHILDRSHSLDARFHAAAALREAVVREWVALGAGGRTALQSYLLSYLVAHAEEPAMQVVRSSLVSALAVLLKRGWLGVEDAQARMHHHRATFFRELEVATSSPSSSHSPAAVAAARRVGVQVLEAVVGEFALSTASPLGLPLEHHAKCAMDLQDHFLQDIFRHAVALGRAAAAAQDGATCAACLSLMTAVLAWDFRRSPASLTAAAAAQGAPAAARDLLSRARGVVVALSNLSSDVFPREGAEVLMGPGGGVRGGYLRAVLRCVVAWVASPRQVVAAAVAGDEMPLWEGCKAILALAAAHPPRLLEDAGNDVVAAGGAGGGGSFGSGAPQQQPSGGFLALLQALTLEVIRVSCIPDSEQWVVECKDMLVESWALMVQRDCSNPLVLPLSVGVLGPPSLPGLAEGAAAVFGALVEAAMRAAEQEVTGGGQDIAVENEAAEAAAEDARMAEAAMLARAAPAATFPLLAGAMAAAQQQLLAAAAAAGGSGGEAWAVSLERLCWLVRMAAHCLADSGAGETPLMPLPLSIAMEGGGPSVAAVEGLTAALLGLPALALQEGAAAVLSPRLMESCVWSLARWSDTYLFPEEAEGLPAALTAAYATRGSGQAEAVADGLARLASTCLVAFPGEAELHGMVCTVLLPVLSRRRPLSSSLLDCSRSWGELCGAFAARRPQLAAGLAPKLQRWLSQSLCQAACGFPSADVAVGGPGAAAAATAAGHYITQLLGPTTAEVRALATRHDLYDMTARADVIAALCGMLERAFGDDPRVGAVLLKLAAAVVEHHVGYLQSDQAHMLMSWVLELLRQYRLGRAARVSLAAAAAAAAAGARRKAHSNHHHHPHRLHHSRSQERQGAATAGSAALLREDAAQDAARELRALLQLLTHITQRDVALAAAASDGWATTSSAGSTPRSVNMGGAGLGPGAAGSSSSRGNTPKGPLQGGMAAAGAGVAAGGGGGGGGGLVVGENESGVAQVRAPGLGWGLHGPLPPVRCGSGSGAVVLTGLDVLLPLLTPELLAAATAAGAGAAGGGGTGGKLTRLLFSLLAYMMEVHPHAVVALPAPHFATLLSCLEAGARGYSLVHNQQQQQQQQQHGAGAANVVSGANGLGPGGASSASSRCSSVPSVSAGGFDGVVVQSALEGLAGLAKYHHQSLLNGGRGFGAHQAPAAAGGGPLAAHLVQLLMQIVLMGDVGPDVVELAGDALLPLLQAEPAAFGNLGAALVQSSDPRVADQVGAALDKLLAPTDPPGTASAAAAAAAVAAASMGLDPRTFDLSRLSRRVFRERLCGVVSELRGLLRVR
ncbi:hypothetical protein VOLCADRAFT_116320 [Volvox carteri f. nagariensis]|uniref:Exportin-4 n=1 Tax=Volvox carteri f. nagariensis TaxID=3068 RepID=D8TL44_VOLCA|nr:uncharacterized protein VOLCADRAFT_116320 [Volvox carteri f. nagariensis]EFJ51675.1 hypothetical protein VOLCADRAFT_116320 [Volvox carteri f. nagariensis]|eukprot:XP_002947085.1 hypothetical protein VOLCADRAFT_116320 [Volvox carteri f. nagariensis]